MADSPKFPWCENLIAGAALTTVRCCAIVIAGTLTFAPDAAAGATPLPPAVTVVPVEVRNVAPVNTFPGQVQAIQSVTLVARVSAFVNKVVFQEGSLVKSGQLLFQLQQGPFQAAVEQAQGSLKQAEATLLNAQLNYKRDSHAGNLAISQQQLQQDISARDVAAGQVTSARGALETAAINLSYCTVTSPIDGRSPDGVIRSGRRHSPPRAPTTTARSSLKSYRRDISAPRKANQ